MSSETYTSGTSGRSLVIVHGRDFKPAGKDLLEFIDAALRAGVERDYPDLLAEYRGLLMTRRIDAEPCFLFSTLISNYQGR